MNNKIIKNLIIIGSVFSFLIFANISLAYDCIGYSCNQYYGPGNSPTYDSGYYSTNYGYHTYDVPSYPQFNNYNYPGPTSQPSSYYYYSNNSNNNSQPTPAPVNNYYYSTTYTTPKVATTTNTDTTKSTVVKSTETNTDVSENRNVVNNSSQSSYDYNNLGASAYGSQITALSLRGSGSFMPSSIWQWLFVLILVLVIVILGRMFVRKNRAEEEMHTNSHAH